ncbi:uncharacterized protein TNCV_260341 [Trichonephila clavipes]|nr:uncharacterized protein TNCV_260341 [Trichonephila clavipes]
MKGMALIHNTRPHVSKGSHAELANFKTKRLKRGVVILERRTISQKDSLKHRVKKIFENATIMVACDHLFQEQKKNPTHEKLSLCGMAAVAEWYRYRIMACLVTSSSPVSLKTRRLGQRCTLNLSKTETSSRWCGVVVRRGGASSGVIHVT